MKLKYKHQKFQSDCAKAVVDVFAGQPYLTPSYMIDRGDFLEFEQLSLTDKEDFTGWSNAPVIPQLTDSVILERIQKIQRDGQIEPSKKLEGKYNLTVEMETGVGKTYTYIKTMYELNKHYGWTKFIIVVPSIAIREGVYKSFQSTQEHFAEEYGKKIRFFIYNSAQLTEIDRFASDNSINVMIINAQAFNAKGKDARRIYMKLDEFRSRRPIDIIARTNPIVIIDEPQSVEGKQTKERLKEFRPLMTLRYSATHRPDSIYNMIYRLDTMDAYNKQLVKKIAVKGISESGASATESFVHLESVNLSRKDPTATVYFDYKGKSGIRQVSRKVDVGYNLYDHSNFLDEYRDNFVVKFIDGRDNSIEFINGIKLYVGDVIGKVNELQLRRIQIRETILSHIQRERQLFKKGIKVLSLFFIDEVEHYRRYDENNNAFNGIFADIFEEEYNDIVGNLQLSFDEEDYVQYLDEISAQNTHAGYFSVDKKGRMTNSRLSDRKSRTSDDIDAYDLIMKNKELLLDQNPKKSPVRFIFSHSALREGWDNPNVFQICTLKQSSSDIRKRQEVGRGLRLCVNQDGERQDAGVLGKDVHNVNVLTIIASESYDSFAKALQNEFAETIGNRPTAVTDELFINRKITDSNGNPLVIDTDLAQTIRYDLIINQYIDKKGTLTEKYYEDKKNNTLIMPEEVKGMESSIIQILDGVYSEHAIHIEKADKDNISVTLDREKMAMPEFKKLWENINKKSVYSVHFDSDELIGKAVRSLESNLLIPKIFYRVETGSMQNIRSKEEMLSGNSFRKEKTGIVDEHTAIAVSKAVKYDLVGQLVERTQLTRKTIVKILKSIDKNVFEQFRYNPEEFIIKVSELINNEKATAVIEHITYDIIDKTYETTIFTEHELKGRLDINAIRTEKNLYDHLIYDSKNERTFAENLETNEDIAVYVKLPDGFYISTPVGNYNPDWAIAFYEGTVKHIYFVAETKGSMDTMELRQIERAKIECAREHFRTISGNKVIYDVVDGYDTLMNKVMK